jgi:hypothetical protein
LHAAQIDGILVDSVARQTVDVDQSVMVTFYPECPRSMNGLIDPHLYLAGRVRLDPDGGVALAGIPE